MIKQLVLVLIVCAVVALATDNCGANVSGPNVASPGKRQPMTSASCQANVSGPNVASPAKRTTQQCSGNGYCSGENCVCLSGYTGADCETPVASTSCQADVSGPNVASPARKVRTTECNGNGACQNGQCVCSNGFYGADCEVPVSSSCSQADVSGPNVASPARKVRTNVCSGNGYCVGNKQCVCNEGFSGSNCETAVTTCPPTEAPTTAAPTTEAPTTAAPTTEAPTTAAPTTAEPTTQTPSPSCQANVSGPNVASPAKRTDQVCSGQGYCDGNSVCVCNAGYSGADCEVAPTTAAPEPTTQTPSPSCQANVSGPNVASPARLMRFFKRTEVCSGQGNCDGNNVCVCNAGYSGIDCEVAPTTAAPTTAAPTTAAPTTEAPTTAAPTSATPTSTENISGDNNARASNGAGKIVSIGGIIAAVAVALL